MDVLASNCSGENRLVIIYPDSLYFNYCTSNIILLLVWSTNGGGAMCFTCNRSGLVGLTLSIIMIMALSTTYLKYYDDLCSDLSDVWSCDSTCD